MTGTAVCTIHNARLQALLFLAIAKNDNGCRLRIDVNTHRGIKNLPPSHVVWTSWVDTPCLNQRALPQSMLRRSHQNPLANEGSVFSRCDLVVEKCCMASRGPLSPREVHHLSIIFKTPSSSTHCKARSGPLQRETQEQEILPRPS